MRIRAFLALVHSIAVTRRIAEEVEQKKDAVRQAGLRVTWVPPANLHLTLKFLGSVEEEALEAVVGTLRHRLGPRPPFEVSARGLGAFPGTEEPKVLWVGAHGGDALGKLARDVEQAMVGLGFPKEERPFHPHITVGRVIGRESGEGGVGEGQQPPRWDPALWTSTAELGASAMSEIVLYESKTLRTGAEYLARARVAIK